MKVSSGRFTLSSAMIAPFLTLPLGVRALSAQEISVGPNVQVSAARSARNHDEVLIAAHPTNPSRLLACSIIGSNTEFTNHQTGAYGSFDGGRTWTPVATDSAYATDPACVFGPRGTAYFTTLTAPMAFGPTSILAYTSGDSGLTWRTTAVPGWGDADRPFVAADLGSPKYGGRVYIAAQMSTRGLAGRLEWAKEVGGSAMTFWRSLDGGTTFEVRAQAFPNGDLFPSDVVVLTDGTVAILVQDNSAVAGAGKTSCTASHACGPAPSASLELLTSTDGGETLNQATQIDDVYGPSHTLPRMAADVQSALFRDRVYVVWADNRFDEETHVVLAYSSNNGKTWSTPRIVDHGRQRRPKDDSEDGATLPVVAVNKDGVVGVLWHDWRRNGPEDDTGYVIRFAASRDGGETFSPSVLVSDSRTPVHGHERWLLIAMSQEARRYYAGVPRTGVRAVVARDHWMEGGHTEGLAADADGVFHALWVDGRTGLHQVWTAPLIVRGPVARHGSSELAELDDVSRAVELELSGPAYDSATHLLTVMARLSNTSPDTLRSPIKVRALMVRSDVATVRVVGADNGAAGDGAVWTFTLASGEPGVLLPGGRTRPRTLRFQLSNVLPDRDWYRSPRFLYPLTLDGEVFAKRSGR